ncbi:MAG: methylated-DNA--[protein]-cysteine S-methyltransferase [Eubacteriales bacterium]|nr:methylated-DNA--[protein]-cysteine S-methyltransferase [Eubacteriales bacterium]
MKSIWFYDTQIGKIGIAEDGEGITQVSLNSPPDSEAELRETSLIRTAYEELEEYFQGKRKSFDIRLHLEGTEFQKKVWQALTEIPYGETRSYQDIARAVGNPKGCRAVGMANNRNPVMILVPCHRVIGKNGKMVGYGGGISVKEALLRLERENKSCDV